MNTSRLERLIVIDSGFTLIELLIALTVIAILAGIAYPSYQQHMIKSRRVEAKAVLLEAAQWMERFHTENNRYDRSHSGDSVALPRILQRVPTDASKPYYTVSLIEVTPSAFSLQAIPIGAQRQDPCGTLLLAHTGVKGVDNTTGYTKEHCW